MIYQIELRRYWQASKRPPSNQSVCDVPRGLSERDGLWEDVDDRIVGPLYRTAISAPDIDNIVPMILI